MPYWTASELAGMLPQAVLGRPLVTATSNPVNLDRFGTLIEMISSEVEGAAAQAGYQTPIPTTATQAFAYVRGVVRYGVGWQALEEITPGHKTADEYRSAYKAAIDQIREGKQSILQSSETGDIGRSLPRGGGIASPVISASWMP